MCTCVCVCECGPHVAHMWATCGPLVGHMWIKFYFPVGLVSAHLALVRGQSSFGGGRQSSCSAMLHVPTRSSSGGFTRALDWIDVVI